MLTINTNLSGYATQLRFKQNTQQLNKSIEQMSTGFKINHACDNSANYCISTDMTTKLNSYRIAEDNTNMGLDMLATAGDFLSVMQEQVSVLSALSTKARNGTYGQLSIDSINYEANEVINELIRIYNSAQYNNIELFNKTTTEVSNNTSQIGESGFINEAFISEEYKAGTSKFLSAVNQDAPDINVKDPSKLADAINTYTKIGIGNAETFAELANVVNNGTNCSGKTIILTDDITLSAYDNWVPIGKNYSNSFAGTFNGNGHSIKGLKINRANEDYIGLFGYVIGSIKNIGLENVNVLGKSLVGGICGNGNVTNSYVTGTVSGTYGRVGGICGSGVVTGSYINGNVSCSGTGAVGGLVGQCYGFVTNCFASGTVTGQGTYTGGLVGYASMITNSFASGSVTGNNFVGGLAGLVNRTSGTMNLENSYSLCAVTGNSNTASFIGGICNTTNGTNFATINITNCFSLKSNYPKISGVFKSENSTLVPYEYPMTSWLAGIQDIEPVVKSEGVATVLQVGIYGNNSSRVSINTNFQFDFTLLQGGMELESTFNAIQQLNSLLNEKQSHIGAMQNTLESALDEINTNYDNLISSRSTLKDADIAQVSAKYIQQQILQQASATLMATANQSPSIALQLLR